MAMNQHLNRCFRRNPQLESTAALGDTVLMSINPDTGDVNGNYILNELSSRIWDLLDGHNTVADLREVVVREYAVDPDTALKDLVTLLGDWEYEGIVQEL